MRLLVPVLAFALTAFACGGSSSETPPPLEPDPTSARYTGPRVSNAPEPAKPAPETAPEEDDAPRTPQKPAAATWGSGKTPAPATSSEGAGQR
jgi:hypothetical protein